MLSIVAILENFADETDALVLRRLPWHRTLSS